MFYISILGASSTPHGRWRADHDILAVSLLGSQRLDFTQAILDEGETRLTVIHFVGGTRIRVPPGVDTTVDGVSILGRRHVEVDHNPAAPSRQRLRITAFTMLGHLEVETAR